MTPRLQARIRPLLKANAFMGQLPDDVLDTILQRGQARTYAKGEFAFQRGDPGDRLMLLVSGGIKLAIISAKAREVVLHFVGPGDVFGEIGALTGSTRTADVVVTQPSTLMEVPTESLRAAMQVPEVNNLMLSTLTERLNRSNQPDLPRLASMDQNALRDLRTKAPTVEALPKAYGEG